MKQIQIILEYKTLKFVSAAVAYYCLTLHFFAVCKTLEPFYSCRILFGNMFRVYFKSFVPAHFQHLQCQQRQIITG